MNKELPRIKLFHGQWYAFGKNTKSGRLLLVPAISYCQWRNRVEKRGIK